MIVYFGTFIITYKIFKEARILVQFSSLLSVAFMAPIALYSLVQGMKAIKVKKVPDQVESLLLLSRVPLLPFKIHLKLDTQAWMLLSLWLRWPLWLPLPFSFSFKLCLKSEAKAQLLLIRWFLWLLPPLWLQ